MQEYQWVINIAMTLLAFGVNYGALRSMFTEFKRETERRLAIIEDALSSLVSKETCDKEHLRNDKEHDEMFSRLRADEMAIVAVKKSQLEG